MKGISLLGPIIARRYPLSGTNAVLLCKSLLLTQSGRKARVSFPAQAEQALKYSAAAGLRCRENFFPVQIGSFGSPDRFGSIVWCNDRPLPRIPAPGRCFATVLAAAPATLAMPAAVLARRPQRHTPDRHFPQHTSMALMSPYATQLPPVQPAFSFA